MSYWLVWLFVTLVRQLCSDGLKARHLVITTFAHAETLTAVLTQILRVVRFTRSERSHYTNESFDYVPKIIAIRYMDTTHVP